ncbi:MAG: hypothetical protein SA339_13040 [Methanomassiliicoccus sp.]|nr:hypothetical protein [Methanomassiliicoccus sp.]
MTESIKLRELDNEMLARDNYPKAAFWLSAIGALLILVQGLMFIFVLSIWSTIEYGGWTGLANVVLGAIMILVAIIIGSAAATLVARPQYNVAEGSTIAFLSFLALFLGGGYVIGSVLGIIGGILAIVWRQKKR